MALAAHSCTQKPITISTFKQKKGHGLNHRDPFLIFTMPRCLYVYPSSPALAESTTAGATSAESTAAGSGSGGFSPQNVASVLT